VLPDFAAIGWRITTVAWAALGWSVTTDGAGAPANIGRQAAIDCGRSFARTASPASMAARVAAAIGELICDSGVQVSSRTRSTALGGARPVIAKCSVAAR